jgi:hypothetical protein
MTVLTDVAGALPPDTGLRIGMAILATDGVSTAVQVAGSTVDCGFLGGTLTTIGQPVALLRCGPTWLCLGQIQTQP